METEPSKAETLKCQTWVLKIFIDCQGCSKKVKRVLQATKGVYTANVDAQQHKVTVTGNVAAETLIKNLAKAGKRAELLPEDIPKVPENPKEGKKQDKKNANDHQDGDKKKEGEEKLAVKPENAFEDGRKGTPKIPEKQLPVVAGGKKKKKKKKEVPTGNNIATDGPLTPPGAAALEPVLSAPPVDLSRANVPVYQNPTVYRYVPPELGVSYSRATYAAAAESYHAAPMHVVSYDHPVVTIPPYDPFIAKDNGNDDGDDYHYCSIM